MRAALSLGVMLGLLSPLSAWPPSWIKQQDGDTRAGHPQEISRFAKPIDDLRSIGYYVGGGAVNLRKSYGPGPDDGTWGWDYQGGRLIQRHVVHGWWNSHYQGGTGAYKTDGPKLPE